MARTVADLDGDLLAEAQPIFSTTTRAATADAALPESVKLARRMEFADAIANGEFELLGESAGRPLRGAESVS
ncbi:type II toxin-antitoxin system VapB family antitoxin [Kitasatospora sp. NPDC051170]|uniref:type II toxin-antitoxin system VapB family antitoxin n=1 Tax=Kitasatospora sp. NPDC051170 TaxID=3364056 RepID=UPI003787CE75